MPAGPLTLQVDSTSDALNANACQNQVQGQCTLREAIQEANSMSGATVDIPAGTYTLTIPPAGLDDNTTGDLNITASMALVGRGVTIIQAGTNQNTGIDRVFHITNSGEVLISNLTISFGQTNSSSDLAIQGGGGILFDGSGNLCLTAIGIVRNTASNQTFGGGLADIGTGAVYLEGVNIAYNTAGNSGGGIEALQSGALHVLNSTIQNNIASGTGTGGGLDANQTSGVPPGNIDLIDTKVVRNTASGLWGGGISVWGNKLVINKSVIGANALLPGGQGAGLFVAGTGNVDVINSTVNGNLNGSPSGNGFNQGGGIYFGTSGAILLLHDDVSNNRVLAGSSGQINEADGGGIFANGAAKLTIAQQTTIMNNTISANVGSKSLGGGIAATGTAVVLADSTIKSNSSTDRAGGILETNGSLSLNSVTIDSNTASIEGGGILIDGGTFLFTDTAITNNTAGDAAVPVFQCGGGASVQGNAIGTISVSTVSGNTGTNGGGLCLANLVQITLLNDTISNNTASPVLGLGGGLYDLGPITVTGSSVVNNSAPQGAGVFVGGGTFTNDTIAGNQPGAGIELLHGPNSVISFSTISGNAIGIWDAGLAGQLSLLGTIIANNSRDCQFITRMVILGYNLFGSQSCGASWGGHPGPGNVYNVNPMLGPLQNNGGPTPTMAPLPGSPAIDAVGTTACPPPATDQQGTTRPQGTSCDIGAVEMVPQ